MKNKVSLLINDLTIGYKTPLSKGINLSIGQNEFVTIMGENGCGKTTLIDCLMGLQKPLQGEITFWGEAYEGLSKESINQKVGWVISQKESYPLHLTIGKYLKLIAKNYSSWNWELCDKLCSSFGLNKEKKLIHLSMGENSKVRLVKALAFEPSLIILDELTANLSPDSKKALTSSIIELFSDNEMSVLYICHSNEEAFRLSDHIYKMNYSGLTLTGGQNG